MKIQAAIENEKIASAPLDRLAQLLQTDMKRVNEVILHKMQSPVPLIPQLAGYLIASGGKRVRPLLTLASARLHGDQSERSFGLAAAVEFIHTATLLHDDVVDESAQRRGQDSANLVFGNQASVLVGDFLFSRAFQLMTSDGSLDVLRILSDASAIIAQGEVMQLAAAHNMDTSMDEYLEIIRSKTAALFAAACEIGPITAGRQPDAARAMAEYGLNLGIAFQIADDVLDYGAAQKTLGKTPGDDFREGKLTAPVLFALDKADDKERAFWQRTLGDKDQKPDDFKTALAILHRHDALALGLSMAREYGEKARLALAEAPDGEIRACLDELVSYTVERSF